MHSMEVFGLEITVVSHSPYLCQYQHRSYSTGPSDGSPATAAVHFPASRYSPLTPEIVMRTARSDRESSASEKCQVEPPGLTSVSDREEAGSFHRSSNEIFLSLIEGSSEYH